MDKPIILAHNIQKTFRNGKIEVHALRGVDLSIAAGEMVAVMAPSGRGNTNLINWPSGLDCFYLGEAEIVRAALRAMNDEGVTLLATDGPERFARVGAVFLGRPLAPADVEIVDDDGNVTGERRFLGLFTSGAYAASVLTLPIVAPKVRAVLEASGHAPGSHTGKDLLQVLEQYPRDELFQASAEELLPVIAQEAQFKDRRTVRVFVRRDQHDPSAGPV